jgi:RNA polymerase sigma-70 factor (ECF subfamily)
MNGRNRFQASEAAKADLLRTFTAALEAKDEQALLALFAPDATWTADAGGRVQHLPVRSWAPNGS